MKETVKFLRERWSDDQLRTVDKQLAEAARNPKGVMPSSPFGVTVDGLADFRGAMLSESVRYLRGVRRVDFSRVGFEQGASITEAELEDCVLDGIDLRGVFVGRRFERCSFTGARFNSARLGTDFIDCDFSRAGFSASVASGTRFTRCVFTGASLNGIMWTAGCTFDHCTFAGLKSLSGSVAGSVFIGTAPEFTGRCITDNARFEGGAELKYASDDK